MCHLCKMDLVIIVWYWVALSWKLNEIMHLTRLAQSWEHNLQKMLAIISIDIAYFGWCFWRLMGGEKVISLSVSFISSLIQQIFTDNSSIGICFLVIAQGWNCTHVVDSLSHYAQELFQASFFLKILSRSPVPLESSLSFCRQHLVSFIEKR